MTEAIRDRQKEDDFFVSEETVDFFSRADIVVVDTSVVAKWFFHIEEQHADKADLILEDFYNNKIRLISPELMLFEITNVLKNKVTQEDTKKICIIDKLYDMGIIFKVDKNILKNSLNNAYKYNLSVYDGIFLATAQYFQGQLVTDDRKLFTNYSNKDKEGSVILLKDYGR